MLGGCGARVRFCGKALFCESTNGKPATKRLSIAPINFEPVASVFSLEKINATGAIECFQRSQDKVPHGDKRRAVG
tara:strand:- start:701 stop:928 length:228 start_codon:yes stop_codon:yes gene_type:complete